MNKSIVTANIKKLRSQTGHGLLDCKKALDQFPIFEEALEYLSKVPVKISTAEAAATIYAVVDRSVFKITSNTFEGLNNDIVYEALNTLNPDTIGHFVKEVSKHTRENLNCEFIANVDNIYVYYHRCYKKEDNFFIVPRILLIDVALSDDEKSDVICACLSNAYDTDEIKENLRSEGIMLDRIDSINFAKSYV